MIAIRLSFPSGRYHATQWGRHVNEGVAEWPPSPYRLLRALYDVWQRKCPHLSASSVEHVLQMLAKDPPRFALPPASASHSRAYLSANAYDPNARNLVFDSFLAFDREPTPACYLAWDTLELDPQSEQTLDTLLANLNYLGRSESWVSAALWRQDLGGVDFNCTPLIPGPEASGDLTSVACAVPAASYVSATLDSPPASPKSQGKRPGPNSKRPAALEARPWLDALTTSTADLSKRRASSPPLLEQVRYINQARVETDPIPRHSPPPSAGIDCVLLSLSAKVLPLVISTLDIGQQVRTRLMGAHRLRSGGDMTGISPLFSGKAPGGGKSLDHSHVYILPLASSAAERGGRIDRIMIISRCRPFDDLELAAIGGVRELWQEDNRGEVRCVATWNGRWASFSTGDGFFGVPAASSRVVESTTPFVAPRHWRRGRDWRRFLESEVVRECFNHRIVDSAGRTMEDGEDSIERVEVLDPAVHRFPGNFHAVEFRRNRKADPPRPGHAIRITFRHPVLTPFSIGYGAHFGLGQFAPLYEPVA